MKSSASPQVSNSAEESFPVFRVHHFATQTSEPLSDLLEEVGQYFSGEEEDEQQQVIEPERQADSGQEEGEEEARGEQVRARQAEERADGGQVGLECDDNNNAGAELDSEQRLETLRSLLAIERERNEQRKRNNQTLRQHLSQQQADYLQLQRDLVEILELAHKIKAQKEAQIERMDETLREKDLLIEQLRGSLDETKVREEFQVLLEKNKQLARIEKEQLREQVNSVEQQLVHERVSNSQTLQQFHEKLDQQRQLHEQELEALRRSKAELELDRERLLSEPKNQVIEALREERAQLAGQLEELKLVLEDSQSRYESLRGQLENLLQEQERQEAKSEEEIGRLHEQQAEHRRLTCELQQKLDERLEMNQILQFNLQRSDKRLKNLLGALKAKEATYKEMLERLQVSHEQEVEQSSQAARALERRLVELEAELDRKQNELVKLELAQENQVDLVRNDRDSQINRLNQERVRLERELQVTENRLAREIEEKSLRAAQVEGLQSEANQFREESKRLSVELTTCEARLSSKQQELSRLLEERVKAERKLELAECGEQVSLELEEAKRHSQRLEANLEELRRENEKLGTKLSLNESHLSKVNAAINRERTKLFEQFDCKLEQIKLEQAIYDRNKVRYKRYGYKLKKYCDHLRQVHEHLCNPTICGYIIGPIVRPQTAATTTTTTTTNSTPIKNRATATEDKNKNSDRSKASAFSIPPPMDHQVEVEGERYEFHYADEAAEDWNVDRRMGQQQPERLSSQVKENIICCNSLPQSQRKCRDRFSIKRTGLSTPPANNAQHQQRRLAANTPPPKSSRRQRSAGTGTGKSVPCLSSANATGRLDSRTIATPESHNYYYIDWKEDFVDDLREQRAALEGGDN